MATFTPRMQLKRPDGSDPFARQDFVDNYNKIDQAPGRHICTSSSRPSWGPAQAGRTITETDTRAEYFWSGTAWQPLLSAVTEWTNTITPWGLQGAYTRTHYPIMTITTSRPGNLLFMMNAGAWCSDVGNSEAYMTGSPTLNGATVSEGASTCYFQWGGANNDNWVDSFKVSSFFTAIGVQAGTYQIGSSFITNRGLPIGVWRVNMTVLLANNSDR